MHARRALTTGAATVLALAALAGPASAAVPSNDDFANATVLSSLPFHEVLDTSDATAEPADQLPVTPCFPDVQSHNSVWYRYTAAADTDLVVDVLDSGFDPGVTIAVGDLNGQPVMQCSIGRIDTHMHLASGQTATILAYDPAGVGGSLDIRIFGAVVPENDALAGATSIGSIPFTDEQYVGLATTDADDEALAQACSTSTPQHSVWYRFTAGPVDGRVLFDSTASKPPGNSGLIIATGSPGALVPLTCGSSVAVVDTSPGTTYYVLAFPAYTPDGRLRLDVSEAPPPAEAQVTLSDRGQVDRRGVAHLSGSYRCSNATVFGTTISLEQGTGRGRATGYAGIPDLVCDGHRHGFTLDVFPDDRAFHAGGTTAGVQVVFCDVTGCNAPFSSQRVLLLPRG